MYNCRQLWDDCQLLKRRFYTCRALYHVEDGNDFVVRTLSAVPASEFGYAPDVLCLAEGSEIRLVMNIDTSASLCTNTTGKVVQIIYENGDVPALLKGEHPPAYCVIVNFPEFRGFPSKSADGERYYPFSDHNLVPVYRGRFTLEKVPERIRKLQARKLCYRELFPIDLSSNLTAHRGQCQTWKDCTLSAKLGFESPQNNIAPDDASIAYVACTRIRITRLKDLFVSPIFPSIWSAMGKSEGDVQQREHEEAVREAATNFASVTGKYEECIAEMEFQHDYTGVDAEWNEIVNSSVPLPRSTAAMMSDVELAEKKRKLELECVPVSLKPALKERYIGIDQGIKTFSMVAVDRSLTGLPKVVGAVQVNLVELGLFEKGDKFTATDVLLLLEANSPLFTWMQKEPVGEQSQLDEVNRVIVTIKQMPMENAYSKQLGNELGTLLQRQFDVTRCIVKMSRPHLHRRTGPMFRLGEEIVESCQLEAASYESVRTRVERKRNCNFGTTESKSGGQRKRQRTRIIMSDVEPSDTSDEEESRNDVGTNDSQKFVSRQRKAIETSFLRQNDRNKVPSHPPSKKFYTPVADNFSAIEDV